MPYFCAVSGLVAVVLVYLAALRYAYVRSAKLRDMVGCVLSPSENCAFDVGISSVAKSCLWFLVIHLSLSFLYHFADLLLFGEAPEAGIADAVSALPLWVVLLLPPVLEETAFRLPLKRRRAYIVLSAAVMMFFVSAILFSTRVYDITWPRLLACVAMVPIAWFWGYKWIAGLRFKTWFWALVLFFAFLHILNYDLGAMGAGEWARVILKEGVKVPSALMFSYVRLRHGFAVSVALHFFVNLTAFLLGSLA